MKSGPILKGWTPRPRRRSAAMTPRATVVLPTPLCVPAITNADRDRMALAVFLWSRRSDDPALDEIHIQRLPEMVRQTVDARFALGGDVHPYFRGRETDGGARGPEKRMAKVVAVEQAVDVRADHPAARSHGAVRRAFGAVLPDDLRERLRPLVNSCADVDLIAPKAKLRTSRGAEDLGPHAALNAPHGLRRAENRSDGQETEPRPSMRPPAVLDAGGIFDRGAQHLKTAADADDWGAVVSTAPNGIREAALIEPVEIVQRLLAAGQDEQIGRGHLPGPLEKRQRDRRLHRQRVEVGELRHVRHGDEADAQRPRRSRFGVFPPA